MIKTIRADFPFFSPLEGQPLYNYLDNAATTQKPQCVIDAMSTFYAHEYASVGRGIYTLAEKATERFESVRAQTAEFFNAAHAQEILFTSGATQSINIVAHAWALQHIKAGDEIVISELEHHANLLPWQFVARQTGAQLKYLPITPDGDLDYERAASIFTTKTKLLAITHSSNALGTMVDLARIIPLARAVQARVLVDGVQSAPHIKIDVRALDCDVFIASSHKMMGPTGLGILYVRTALQREMLPYQYGGGMVFEADYDGATFLRPPHLFYAGTPPVAEVIGYGAVLSYYNERIAYADLAAHESMLMTRLIDGLAAITGVTLYGPLTQLKKQGHIVTFTLKGVHCHDVAAYLDTFNICVRSGHYCAQPLVKKFALDGSVRVSIYAYTTMADIESFLDKIDSLSMSI